MAKYDYVEKAVKVTRREFVALTGVAAAVLWTGAYAVTDLVQDRNKYIKMRSAGLYSDDKRMDPRHRQSHNNAALQDMYDKLAQRPMSHLAEELFHTKYVDRTKLG